jgi:hypothetical protein
MAHAFHPAPILSTLTAYNKTEELIMNFAAIKMVRQ